MDRNGMWDSRFSCKSLEGIFPILGLKVERFYQTKFSRLSLPLTDRLAFQFSRVLFNSQSTVYVNYFGITLRMFLQVNSKLHVPACPNTIVVWRITA